MTTSTDPHSGDLPLHSLIFDRAPAGPSAGSIPPQGYPPQGYPPQGNPSEGKPSRPTLTAGAAKVPQIGILFWVVKVLTTGVGEAASDFLAAHNLIAAAGIGLVAFLVGLTVQLRVREYHPAAYWFAVTMVAVFGTMAADAVHVLLGLPYWLTSTGYAATVASVFAVWSRSEGTLDIHSIRTRRRELFYWAAVVATFALGTALGDLSAFTLGLGYAASAVLFGALILLPLLGWWRLGLSPVTAFWSAYVLTRPLGASLADWLGKPTTRSGLGLGDGPVTLAGVALIVAVVAGLSIGHHRRLATGELPPLP